MGDIARKTREQSNLDRIESKSALAGLVAGQLRPPKGLGVFFKPGRFGLDLGSAN